MNSDLFPTFKRLGLDRFATRETGLILATLVFFFVSGACGLLYQVVWTRKLVLLFGTTAFAVSTVLSIFFLGLGIGSLWGGRWADRLKRPLFVYGVLEMVIGVWAMAFILLIDASESAVVSVLRGVADARVFGIIARGLLAAGFLIVPVTLMGATLPILGRFVTMKGPVRGLRVGALYTLNTAGAVAGCAFTGFVLIADYGYMQTTAIGAALNVGVGLLAIGLSIAIREGRMADAVPEREVATKTGPVVGRGAALVVVGAFAVSGFASLALEVLWTRLLVLVFYGTTYAFTTMLTTVLCGIALGSAVASLIVDRIRNRVAFFGVVQLATAIACLAMLPVFAELPGALREMLRSGGYQWEQGVTSRFVAAFSVLFWPTFLFGMSFPAAFAAVADSRARLGTDLGRLYSANTFGGVVGSLAGGFLVLPLLGVHDGIVALALFIGATGLALVLASPQLGGIWKGGWIAAGIAGAVWAVGTLPEDVSDSASGWVIPADHNVLHFRETVEGTVVVSAPRDAAPGADRVLWINSVQATTSIEKGVKMNRFQGVLPLLFDRQPDTALFMCFGSGITAGTLSLSPFERIDAVEISEGVLDAAHFFETDNFGIGENPRGNVTFTIDDGRNFLLTTEKDFDLITFEPMPLALAGVSTFYTHDYYLLCRDRLAPGGLVSQWVPLHGLSPEVVRSLTKTFVDVFPESTAWFVNADLFLIGSNQPLRLDVEAAQERIFGNEVLAAALDQVFLGNLEEILAGYFMGPETLQAYAESAEIMTDDRPWAEFVAPREMYQDHVEADLVSLEPFRESPVPLIVQASDPEWADWIEGLERRIAAHASDYQGLKRYYAAIRSASMEDFFRESLRIDPANLNARFYLSEILLARSWEHNRWEEYEKSIPMLEEAQHHAPHRGDVALALGDAYAGAGRAEDAVAQYRRYLDTGGQAERAQEFVADAN